MEEKLKDWLNSWQRISFNEFKAVLPGLNLPGAIAIHSSWGSILQICYLGNLQRFESIACQFGPTFELMTIFDPEFYISYWTFPPGIANLEVELPDTIARIGEDLPLQSRKKSFDDSRRQQKALPVPFAETEEESELSYA